MRNGDGTFVNRVEVREDEASLLPVVGVKPVLMFGAFGLCILGILLTVAELVEIGWGVVSP